MRIYFNCWPRRTRQILLDPDRFLNRLWAGLVLVLPRILATSLDRDNSSGEEALSATEKSERLARIVNIRSLFDFKPAIVLFAVTLSGCDNKPASQAAAAAPPVTVAQPVK